jgi:tRNA(Ile2) C34 agmatinyltransferase TiaS
MRISNHGLVTRYRSYVSAKNFLNFLPEKKCPSCGSGMSSNGTGKNCRNCVSANLKNAPGTKSRKSASESRSSGSAMMKTWSGNR